MRYNVHVTGTRFIGVDLAWREGSADLVANETGVAVIEADGRVLDAAWKRGVEQTIAWVDSAAADGDAVMFVDAPLVGPQRDRPAALREAGWTKVLALEGKVSANTTNTVRPGWRRAAPAPGRTVRLAIFRWQRRAAARRPHHLGNLPVRHAGRRRRAGL